MDKKFRYIIFPDNIYQITVEDYDLNPYTFEVTGEEIAAVLRRQALLDRQFEQLDFKSDSDIIDL